MPSNQPVPVRGHEITVDLLGAAEVVLSTATVTTDGTGLVQVADLGAATAVRVTDRLGNSVTGALP